MAFKETPQWGNIEHTEHVFLVVEGKQEVGGGKQLHPVGCYAVVMQESIVCPTPGKYGFFENLLSENE